MLNDNVESQNDIDNVYEKFETILTNEIDSVLKPMTIKVSWGADNKKRRIKKPWLNDQLSEQWNKTCDAEKIWLGCTTEDKKKQKVTFLNPRNKFDKDMQKAKRQFRRLQQIETDNLEEKNPREFWREIGKIGVGNERFKHISSEVKTRDGIVSKDPNVVLDTWKNAISDWLNPENDQCTTASAQFSNITKHPTTDYLNQDISLTGIMTSLHKLKSNKAPGFDNITSEVLKCGKLNNILQSLFNKCFKYGYIPSAWKRAIINPIPVFDVRLPWPTFLPWHHNYVINV